MRTVLAAVLVLGVAAAGAEIRFEGEVRVGGEFRLVVSETDETSGSVSLLNLRTTEVVRFLLHKRDGVLATGPIRVRRPCDGSPLHSVLAQPGDVLVAATDLGGGTSATAQVGPRPPSPGHPSVKLERWDDEQLQWVPADRLFPARYRATVEDAGKDSTCERDKAELSFMLGEKTFPILLLETSPVSGVFQGEFALVLEPKLCELWVRLLTVEGTLIGEGPAVNECTVCPLGGSPVRIPVSLFPVEVAFPSLGIPVGCCQELRVQVPSGADEIRWCVDGVRRAAGPTLHLCGEVPQSVGVVALVRQGLMWSQAEAVVDLIPRAKLTLLDAETALPAPEPWSCAKTLRIKLEGVPRGGGKLFVGKLGTDPRTKEFSLTDVTGDLYVSPPFVPSDFLACAGDVLWVQYKDPTGCYTVYTLLPLR